MQFLFEFALFPSISNLSVIVESTMSTAIGDPAGHEATDQSFAFSTTLNLNGQYVRSIKEGLAIIKTLSPKDIYPAALMIQDHAHGVIGDAVRSLQELYDFIEKGEFWRMYEVSLKSFRNSWQVTRNAVKSKKVSIVSRRTCAGELSSSGVSSRPTLFLYV